MPQTAVQPPSPVAASAFLLGMQRAVFDLDGTIVHSRNFHLELHCAAAGRFGARRSEVEPVYQQLRGQPYHVIFSTVAEAAGAPVESYRREVFRRLEHVDELAASVRSIPDAALLLDWFQTGGRSGVICTGSPRPIAEFLLQRSGLAQHADGLKLFCSEDACLRGLNKSDTGYWDLVLGQLPRDNVVAFDDHPAGVPWLLDVARVGRMVVRPTGHFARDGAALHRGPERLLVLPETQPWSALWDASLNLAGERIQPV